MDINKAQKQICLKNMFIAAYRNYQLHNDQKSNQDKYISFSNFSCRFLNPNNFFQFEF